MNTQILRTTLFCIVIVLTLFSDKLFKQQHLKIVKIICSIILLVISLSFLF